MSVNISAYLVTPKRTSARQNRARFGLALTKSKVNGIVNSIVQTAADVKQGKTVSDLFMQPLLSVVLSPKDITSSLLIKSTTGIVCLAVSNPYLVLLLAYIFYGKLSFQYRNMLY